MALDISAIAAEIIASRNLLQHGFMHVPYVSLLANDTTLRLRDNSLMQCIRLEGANAVTSSSKELESIRDAFASVLAQLSPEYTIYTHKVSRQIDLSAKLDPFRTNDFASYVDAAWRTGLAESGLRDCCLTISVIRSGRLKRTAGLFSRASKLIDDRTDAGDLDKLDETVRYIRSAFGSERSEILTGSSGRLLGFLGSIQTANEQVIYPSKSLTPIADDILNDRVTFDQNGFALNDGPGGDRYGEIRALKAYPPESWVTIFDELALPCDYVITQSFTPLRSNEAVDLIDRKRKVMRSTADVRMQAAEQLSVLHEAVMVNDVSLGQHHFTVALIHKDKSRLAEIVSELEGNASNIGVRLVRDRIAIKAHYFGQFPGNLSVRPRQNTITNVHFTNYASMHRVPLGKEHDQLPWETPIAVFPTSNGSPYQFSFHRKGNAKSEPPAGHTLILGETGSGKSLLASFLLTQVRRTGARIFLFDYRQGLEMFTRAMGGSYSIVESGKPTGLNPLSVEVDEEGVDWLTSWLSSILAPADDLDTRQTKAIVDNVRRNADAANDPKLRNWSDFAKLFGATDDNRDLRKRIEEWAEHGRYGWVFGKSTHDSFSLDGDVVGFDLTQILDAQSDRERMAVLTYIFRRIERQMRDKKRTIVLIDEAWKAIDNPFFASVIEQWLATLRKQNALVIMLAQNPSQLTRSKVGERVFSFFPTTIVFPDGKSAPEDYGAMRLNEAEEAIVTSRSAGRKFLLRDDQNSVVLDGDASSLGGLLHILGGGNAGLSVVGKDYRNVPDFWRKAIQ